MECAAMKRMKLLRPYSSYRAGQIVDVPGGLAADWIARKIAVEDKQAPLIETASVERPVETADATPRRRRRT
jgi:hypothetical protein